MFKKVFTVFALSITLLACGKEEPEAPESEPIELMETDTVIEEPESEPEIEEENEEIVHSEHKHEDTSTFDANAELDNAQRYIEEREDNLNYDYMISDVLEASTIDEYVTEYVTGLHPESHCNVLESWTSDDGVWKYSTYIAGDIGTPWTTYTAAYNTQTYTLYIGEQE